MELFNCFLALQLPVSPVQRGCDHPAFRILGTVNQKVTLLRKDKISIHSSCNPTRFPLFPGFHNFANENTVGQCEQGSPSLLFWARALLDPWVRFWAAQTFPKVFQSIIDDRVSSSLSQTCRGHCFMGIRQALSFPHAINSS